MDLTEKLNKGFMMPFKVYNGPIPQAVPAIRKDGRAFAGGDMVLAQKLDALQPQDEEKIDGWGNNYFDLADLCLTFEDLVKLQPNSPLLTGIRGVVNAQNGLFIAVDADAVKAAVSQNGWKYFKAQLSASEKAEYTARDGEQCNEEAKDIILLPYDGKSFKLNPDQFKAVKAEELKRKNMIYGRDMKKDEIVKRGKVIHSAYKIYPANLVVLLTDKVFEYAGKKWGYDTNMGLFLPDELQNIAEGRALCALRLDDGSRLDGRVGFGVGYCRSVGVASGFAEGGAQKFMYKNK